MTQIISDIQKALDILGLPSLVTREDIKKQYRYLAKKNHPDLGGSPKDMEMINSSYRLLITYIEQFRYTFSNEEISRQFPGADYAERFKP
ncbi:MAG: J domain-containing protein [Campylobacterota bacterium]|nr:J domain-containing protein [Campylobacterota bacterium]